QGLGEPLDGKIRRTVGPGVRHTTLPHNRRGVINSPSRVWLQHRGEDGFTRQKRPDHLAIRDTPEQFLAEFYYGHAVSTTGDGGIVDQNVDAAKGVESLLHNTSDVAWLADIPDQGQTAPPLCLDLLDRAVHVVPVDGLFIGRKGRRVAACSGHPDTGPPCCPRHRPCPPHAPQPASARYAGRFHVQSVNEVLLCLAMYNR